MGRMKKVLALFALVIMVGFSMNTVKAADLSGVIDNITVEKTNGSSGNFGQYENTTVKVYWSITEPVHEGDTFSFSMSNRLYLPTNMTFDLVDEDENVLGVVNYDAATRMAVVTFNSAADGMMDVSGIITFKTRLNVKLSEVERIEDINFEYDGKTTTVPIPVDPSQPINPNETIYKWGIINSVKTTIDFSIRVNYQKLDIKNAVVSDNVGVGHEIDYSSFNVYKIYLDSVGNVLRPAELVEPTEYNLIEKNSHEFDIELGDIDQTYRIDYKTNITDPSLQSYVNKATLTGENITTSQITISAITSDGSGVGSGSLGKIKVVKLDADNHSIALANASFKLLDSSNNIVSEFTTNSEGVANVENLKFGEYTLVETSAPDGYRLDISPINVSITDVNLKTVTIDNKRSTGSISLVKYSETQNVLPGATFGIWNASQDPNSDTPLRTVVSSADGKVIFDNLVDGSYKIKEIAAPDGYVLDSTIYERTVSASNPNINIGDITNDLIKGKVTLTKLNEESNALAGATFGIWKSTQDPSIDTPLAKATSVTGTGLVEFTDLVPGSYKVKETVAPTGYVLSTTVHTITVPADGSTASIGNVTNDLIKGKVTLTKLNEESNALTGATFGIWKSTQDPSIDTPLATATSATGTGLVEFTDLVPGSYKVKETVAPTGYVLSTTVHDVTIPADGTTASIGNVTNTLIRANIEFNKVDEDLDPLAGATFGIWRDDQNPSVDAPLKTATSATGSGKVVFTDMVEGTYKIKETIAPGGYNLITIVYPATVSGSSTVTIPDVVNSLTKGSILLVKEDEAGQPLEGVEFGLWESTQDPATDTPIATMESDSSGIISFTDLVPKTYLVKETKALTGYVVDNTVYTASITLSNLNIDLGKVINVLIKGKVTLTKLDEENAALGGATFGIWKSTQDPTTDTPLATAVSATGTGLVEFSDLLPGTYKVKETIAPTGYVLSTTVHTITVPADGATANIGNVTNELIKGSVSLKKVDEDSNALAGATFGIWKADADLERETALLQKTSLTGTGKVTFADLVPGDYIIKEISAPSGYHKVETEFPVTISENDLTISINDVENRLIVGSVEFNKVDEDNNPLAGVEFGIWAKDKNPNSDAPLKTTVSNSEGKVLFDELIPGDYIVKETKALSGYVLDDTEYPVTITNTDLSVKIKDVVNKLIRGSITLKKVDEEGNNLNGAKFGIWNKDQNTNSEKPIKEVTSNPNVLFDNLLPGEYIIKEIAAPSGYILDEKEHKVTITLDKINIDLGNIENKKVVEAIVEDEDPRTPVTGTDITNIILLLTAGTGLSLSCLLVGRKRI